MLSRYRGWHWLEGWFYTVMLPTKHRETLYGASIMQENRLVAGALPWILLEELTALP